jgi:hypothetical protein
MRMRLRRAGPQPVAAGPGRGEGGLCARFYHVNYRADGSIESVTPKADGVPAKVTKRLVAGYDRIDFPDRPIVPNMSVVHDRIMLEICGAAQGAAGFVRRAPFTGRCVKNRWPH